MATPEEMSSRRRKILIVEYDQILRLTLAHLLRRLGHDVREVWSAEDARYALTTFTPDVAVAEVRLPGAPGDAFALYLRHKVPPAQIILISDEYRAAEFDYLGPGVEILLKPVNVNTLLTLLNSTPSLPPPTPRRQRVTGTFRNG